MLSSVQADVQLITTIGERCRVCYMCVRDCPAKAIRIAGGQAEVLSERCIGCGNCVRVCSQKAKRVYDSVDEVRTLLRDARPTAAILAPSFAAEFAGLASGALVGALRALGFGVVSEVAFGADLVAGAYRRMLEATDATPRIATTCPAAVAYIEKYHPNLVPFLAPIASPMLAQARVLRRLHGPRLRVVFVGPCLAKKVEGARGAGDSGEIDAVLTFVELRRLFVEARIDPAAAAPAPFDPPHARLGGLFPLSRGILQAASMFENLLHGDLVAADGRVNFAQAIDEFADGALDARLLEVLCCNGCIMGSGMSVETPLFRRRAAISQHVRRRIREVDEATHAVALRTFDDLDLGVAFAARPVERVEPSEADVAAALRRMGKEGPEDELNCGACGYATCREHAVAVVGGLAESEMCLPHTIDRLRSSLAELRRSNAALADTQQALINAEKLASMGQLSAGIAHEINNPLGVILLYSKMLLDEADRAPEMAEDLGMIAEQAERCRKIVSGLLNFARRNKVVRRPVNLCVAIDRCLKAVRLPEGIEFAVAHGMADAVAELDEDQIVQVLTNLVGNAVEAMGAGGRLTVATGEDGAEVWFEVRDTGPGISRENRQKIFEPFFTTKQLGKGTGLGLAVAYGIVKMHNGRIDCASNADPAQGPTGTAFRVMLPRRGAEDVPWNG